MKTRRSLYRNVMYWLGSYAVLLTGAVVLHGFMVNEFAESLMWESLLTKEMDHYLERMAEDPEFVWQDTDALQLYRIPGRIPPPGLRVPTEGIHDELRVDGRQMIVLAREAPGGQYFMALDITELEARETTLTLFVVGLTAAMVAVLVAVIAWRLRRFLQPLSRLASRIDTLAPDSEGQQIPVDDKASSEIHVITGALNSYLRRQEEFVERERAFNNIASHELRTPIAVIAGASELALQDPVLPGAARRQLQRILNTARNVEQLIALLLSLAKDPARLARDNDSVALHELLPEIVDDHLYLTHGRSLTVVIEDLRPCVIEAPPNLVRAAIGNLLRNAIENSDQGEIRTSLDADGTVTIRDPGHGMTPEEISRIHAQIAREDMRGSGGIGLELLGRLCEHLGWTLSFMSAPGRGTISRLRFRA